MLNLYIDKRRGAAHSAPSPFATSLRGSGGFKLSYAKCRSTYILYHMGQIERGYL